MIEIWVLTGEVWSRWSWASSRREVQWYDDDDFIYDWLMPKKVDADGGVKAVNDKKFTDPFSESDILEKI